MLIQTLSMKVLCLVTEPHNFTHLWTFPATSPAFIVHLVCSSRFVFFTAFSSETSVTSKRVTPNLWPQSWHTASARVVETVQSCILQQPQITMRDELQLCPKTRGTRDRLVTRPVCSPVLPWPVNAGIGFIHQSLNLKEDREGVFHVRDACFEKSRKKWNIFKVNILLPVTSAVHCQRKQERRPR